MVKVVNENIRIRLRVKMLYYETGNYIQYSFTLAIIILTLLDAHYPSILHLLVSN